MVSSLPSRTGCIGTDILLQQEMTQSLRRSGGLDQIDENHMRKLSGQPAKGHSMLLKHSEAILKG